MTQPVQYLSWMTLPTKPGEPSALPDQFTLHAEFWAGDGEIWWSEFDGDESFSLVHNAVPGSWLRDQLEIFGQFLHDTSSPDAKQALEMISWPEFYDSVLSRIWKAAQICRPYSWRQLVAFLQTDAGSPIAPAPLAITTFSLYRYHGWISNVGLHQYVQRYQKRERDSKIFSKINDIVREMHEGDLSGSDALEKLVSLRDMERIYA